MGSCAAGRLDENLMDKEELAGRGFAAFALIQVDAHPVSSARLFPVRPGGECRPGRGRSLPARARRPGRRLEEIQRPFWKLLPPPATPSSKPSRLPMRRFRRSILTILISPPTHPARTTTA
jgi:hypothetical protein